MAVITIDGTRIEVPEDKNVLECALDAGIYIPHLCHHKDLSPLGSCRMCIVRVDGSDEIQTSCTLRARDGMQITTKDEEIDRLRMLALELLLTGHPAECTGCLKYGNCELQTLIQYIGPRTGRLKSRSKGFKAVEENPILIHDMNRCILCGRCVRACGEMRGVGVLSYQKKELETYVGTLHGKLLKEEDCRFCTACAAVCPTGTIRDKILASEEGKNKEDTAVPCKAACPAHTDIPKYVRYIKEGRYDEAAAVIREKVPFPKSLGYVCSHVCEASCRRKEINSAISIRELKRYAAEHDTGALWRNKGKQLPSTGKSVCVVGGGPAGMTAAYYLSKQGHNVCIKEALPRVGGMLLAGIPAYRLPREIIAEEARIIEEAGVKIETNTRVEQPLRLLEEYDAVLLTIGTHVGVRLPLEGSNLAGTILNTDFLRNASFGNETGIGEKIVVLGGGNVAFDCARSAVRLKNAEVHLACLEARDAMTADDEEIEEAIREGIIIHPSSTFERITEAGGRVSGVDFMKVKSFTFDENRKAVIVKEEDSLWHIECDTVIFAVGQRPGIDGSAGLDLIRGSYIALQKDMKAATPRSGVFAAGDAVYGTQSVIMAIAAGRDAASEIDRYLGGDGDIEETFAPDDRPDAVIGKVEGFSCLERENGGLKCETAACEAGRCLQCDLRLQISEPRLWGDFAENREGV